MKRLLLIRHAKSSWNDPGLADFDRPLNKRGKKDGPEMAARLAAKSIVPDLIIASPAKRARKTAEMIAKGVGYAAEKIIFDQGLYLSPSEHYLKVIAGAFRSVSTLFIVGHNETISELGNILSGERLGNVPTCGIVALEFEKEPQNVRGAWSGRLLFFDYPKKQEL